MDDVEIVKRALTEFARGNFRLPEIWHADVRIRWLHPVGTEMMETVGLEEMNDVMMDWLSSWDSLSLAAEQVIDAGEQVVVIGVWRGRGKTSAIGMEWRHGEVWTVRDRRVASVIAYREPADALRAAGLET